MTRDSRNKIRTAAGGKQMGKPTDAFKRFIDDFYGFVFKYENNELNLLESKSKKEVAALPSGTGNDDALFILCNRCDRFMHFEEGTEELLSGVWSCPVCGAAVPEERPYVILHKENQKYDEWLYREND